MCLLYHKHSIIEWVNIKQQSHYISFWLAWCYDYHYHYHLPLPFIFNSSLQIHVCFAKAANIFCLIFIINLAAVKLKGLIHNHNNVIGLVWHADYFYYLPLPLPLPFIITIYYYHLTLPCTILFHIKSLIHMCAITAMRLYCLLFMIK